MAVVRLEEEERSDGEPNQHGRDWARRSESRSCFSLPESRVSSLIHYVTHNGRPWNCKYATVLNYRNAVVEDGEMLKSRLAALPYE